MALRVAAGYTDKITETRSDGGVRMTEAETGTPIPDAGHPALAFLNTVSSNGKSRDTDTFASGDALLVQLRAGGLKTACDPPGAGQLHGVRVLREAAYGVCSAISAGRPALREDTLLLETAIKSAVADASLVPGSSGPLLRPGPMGGLTDTLILSILDLLQSDNLSRLRECRGCTHLFIDHGRGPGRRWCSMARCGNRAKAQGFRDRRRAAG
jgi:predicted RNA-binding Zn ribbon-like protein